MPLDTGPNDDHRGATDDIAPITVGGSPQSGVIGTGDDIDRFRVDLVAGQRYRFSLDTAMYHAEISLSRSNTVLADDNGGSKGGPTQIDYTAEVTGTYYLDATGLGNVGNYTVQASLLSSPVVTPQPAVTPQPTPVGPTDDYPATNDTNGTVVVNGGASAGKLEQRDDVDSFRIVLDAGTAYLLTLEGQLDGLGMDTWLRVRAEDGRTLASDDDGAGTKNGASRLAFTPTYTGTYYLDVSSDSGALGSYRIAASGDDFADTTATRGLIVLDRPPVNGTIERPQDTDVLRVDLRAGTLYRFQVDGLTLDNLHLAVQAADGWRTGGTLGQLNYLARTDGTYYIFINARDSAATGTYSVTATTVADDLPASNATPGVIQTSGAKSTATLEALEDVDRFRIDLVGGTSYKVAAATTDSGRQGFYNLRLLGQDGAEIAVSGSSGTKNGTAVVPDSQMTFTAPATGTYYVDVWGPAGGYQVSAVTPLSMISATPADSTADVPRSTNLVLTFPRAVQAGYGYVNIQTSPNGGSVQRIFIGDTSQVSIAGPVVTIDPAHDLSAGIRYFVSIDRGALRDADGNPSVGMEDGKSLSFTTQASNRVPTATDHTLGVRQGDVVTGLLPAATDADADSISYEVQEQPRQGHVVIEPDGRYTYEAPFLSSGADQFRFSVKDSQGGMSVYTATVSVAALPAVEGTAQADALSAATGPHRYLGLDGNDRITTGASADIVDGGGGIDTLVLSVPRSAATLQHRSDGGWTISSSPSGTDQVFGVERVRFSDVSIALDIGGAAGQVARVIGAVMGPAKVQDAALIGRYLALADSGVSGDQLVHQALADPLFAALAGSRSNADVIKHVYTNLVGSAPGANDLSFLSSLITGGQYTQDSLLWWAASLDLTAVRIDLNGVADHGLSFLPVAAP